jgi:hypothetical protein
MSDTSVVGGYPRLRWQQTFNVGYVPNNVVSKIFMATSLDLRDDHNLYRETFCSSSRTIFVSLVFILELNMMLVIDFHVLVLQLLMDNK